MVIKLVKPQLRSGEFMPYQKCYVKADYRTCCFCDKPKLPEGKKHTIKARMETKRIFDAYAKEHNLMIVQYGGTSRYSATAVSNFRCKHNEKQFIGLTLGYYGQI